MMMENIYVIKVKTRPPLSSLYPSERRYSASTVGGLSFVHFGLGALSLLLGTLALSLQGPILSVTCLVPFATGILAWRRWYIDRNITIFFYGCLFSLVAATLCFVATVLDIAATTSSSGGSFWTLRKILDPPQDFAHPTERTGNDTALHDPMLPMGDHFNISDHDRGQLPIDLIATLPRSIVEKISNAMYGDLAAATNFKEEHLNSGTSAYDDSTSEASSLYETNAPTSKDDRYEADNGTSNRSLDTTDDKVVSFWRGTREGPSQTKTLLTVNVLVAALLEVLWSLLSARIALRGMMNRLPETGYCNNATGCSKPEGVGPKRKPPPPRPDILDHDRRLSESLRNLSGLRSFRSTGPNLPLPESSREFRERVERFLANQAEHRVVEGACT